MGICYRLILLDDFNWGYIDTSKEKKIEEFRAEANPYCFDIEGQWYGGFIVDVDKWFPLTPERIAIIKKYSDSAYYIADIALTSIVKIE